MVAEQLATLQHGGDRKSDQAANLPVDTQATAAELLNVSERSVRAARKIRSTDTQVADLVNAGTVNLHEGSKLIALPAECRGRAIEAVVSGADIRTAVRIAKKNDYNAKVAAFRPKPLDGKYRILYADPPWIYHLNQASGIAEDHYDCLDDAQLCEYRPGGVRTVKELADRDAVLFLWTTAPMLQRAFPIIDAWGFEYKTFFVWDKVKHNVGYYNSVRAELLLVCTRGSCTPDTGKLIDSVQTIERSDKHSEKPQEFYDIIEAMYDHGRKLELFARNPRQGWDADGNESAPIVETAAA
jgi:N6-adenosine-specific RNA methylase IME4